MSERFRKDTWYPIAGHRTYLVTENQSIVCDTCSPSPEVAEFIAEACNAYDDLVCALEDIAKMAEGRTTVIRMPDGRQLGNFARAAITKSSGVSLTRLRGSTDMLDTLKAVAATLGDDDLPDNGERSGAAVTDLLDMTIKKYEPTTEDR